MINAIHIALSGLQAAGKRAEASASNIANMTTSGSLEPGGKAPYGALTTVQTAVNDPSGNGAGITAENVPSNRPFVPAYSPGSPFANSDGLIGVPNVDLAEEIVNLKLAETAYKASAKTIRANADMQDDLLRALDRKS